jgi:N12 class adenine-specific DNA methylase/2'-5' RNA ligase
MSLPGVNPHPAVPLPGSSSSRDDRPLAQRMNDRTPVPGGEGDLDGLAAAGDQVLHGPVTLAKGLKEVYTPQPGEQGTGVYGERGVGAISHPMTPEQQKQANSNVMSGAAKVVAGAGETALTLDAPGIGGTATRAILGGPGKWAARKALLTIVGGFAAGTVSEKVADKAAEKFGFSEGARELTDSLAFFVPTLAGAASGVHIESMDRGESGGLGASAFGGKVKAGVASTPEQFGGSVKVGDTQFDVRVPRGPKADTAPTPQIPSATEVAGQQATQDAIGALTRGGDQDQAASNAVQGVPPPQPPKPPMPQGMEHGQLRQETVTNLARAISLAPEEMHGQVVMEAHENLAKWMAEQGRVLMPDGTVEIVDSPKAAAKLAAKVINDEVARHDEANKQQAEQEAKPAKDEQSIGGKGHEVVPETRATIDAQMESLTGGSTDVVMLPKGSTYVPKVPEGFTRMDVRGDHPGAGTYIYNPQKIRAATIREAAKAGTHGDLLGHVQTKEEVAQSENPVTVQAAKQDGTPIQDSVVDGTKPELVQQQADVLAERHPGADIHVKAPEQVIAERQQAEPPLPEGLSFADEKPESDAKVAGAEEQHPNDVKGRQQRIERVGKALESLEPANDYEAHYGPSWNTKVDHIARRFAIDDDAAEALLSEYVGAKHSEKMDVRDDFRKDAMKRAGKPHDENLVHALTMVENGADRWKSLRERGATDEQLKEAIGKEFGQHSTTDYNTMPLPSFQERGGKVLKGKDLIADVRRLLDIGHPKADAPLLDAEPKKETKYEYGSTQHDIDPKSEAAQSLQAVRAKMDPADLAGKGTDIDADHVTVRYGVQGDKLDGIREYLKKQAPFEARLGKVDSFPPSKNSDGAAVLKAQVESDDLHRMNAEIEKHGEFKKSDFPDYKPHATIAYVKPEAVDKYVGDESTAGKTFTVDHVAISDRNGNKEVVKLEGKRDAGVVQGKYAPTEITINKSNRERLLREAEDVAGGWKMYETPHGAVLWDGNSEGKALRFGHLTNEPEPGVEAAKAYAEAHPATTPTEPKNEDKQDDNPGISEKYVTGPVGHEVSIKTQARSIPAKYRLVDLMQLEPSHSGADFTVNPKYPKAVQERAYDKDKEGQTRVIQQAQNFDPDYVLTPSLDALHGAPIITPEGYVLSGNSRTMSLERLYNSETQNVYQRALVEKAEQFGFTRKDVESLNEPVLVRQIDAPRNEWPALASDFNKAMAGALTDYEKAVSVGRRLTPDTLSSIASLTDVGGGRDPLTMREVLADDKSARRILELFEKDGAITSRERPALVDSKTDGLNEEGKTFVEHSLLGAVLADAGLLKEAPKGTLSKIEASLGGVAVLGSRNDSWNILPVLRAAVAEHGTITRKKLTIDQYIDQRDMFTQRNPVTEAMVRILGEKTSAVRDAFRRFAGTANLDVPDQMSLIPAVPPAEAFNDAFGAKLSDEEYYDGLERAASEDPLEKQAELEGKFRRQRTRGLTHGKPRESKPRTAKASEATKGERVRFKDKQGQDQEGTVVHANPLVTRIKDDAGKEFTIRAKDEVEKVGTEAPAVKRDVLDSYKVDEEIALQLFATGDERRPFGVQVVTNGEKYAAPINRFATEEAARKYFADWIAKASKGNPDQPASNAVDKAASAAENKPDVNASEPVAERGAAGRREASDSGSGDLAGVDGEPAGVREGSGEERRPAEASEADSPSLRDRVAAVRSEGSEPGSGQGSDSGIDTSPGRELIEETTKRLEKPVVRNRNWFTHPEDFAVPSGQIGRLRANIEAIKLLRDVEKDPRPLTDDEKLTLAKFAGWGALPHVFNPYQAPYGNRDSFIKANVELRKFMSDAEFTAGARSTQNAHYTAPEVVRWMWDMAERIGFKAGTVLEPSMGTGNFFGMMPEKVRGKVNAIGNELEPVTYGIAKLLYPDATVHNRDFKELILADDSVDFAIGNVPFGEVLYDPKYPKLKARIHDYFFVKTLDKVRPGGIVAFITSTGTMDRQSSTVRDLLASKADLVAAFRLPSGAFKANAGTDVTTDLIVLQKRAPGEAVSGPAWAKTKDMRVAGESGGHADIPLNEYFHAHPENMLGMPSVSKEMYGNDRFKLVAKGDINEALKGALESVPQDVMKSAARPMGSTQAETPAVYAPSHIQEDQFVVKGDKLFQNKQGELKPAKAVSDKDGKLVLTKVARIKGLVSLRDGMNRLMADMLEAPDSDEANARLAKQRESLLRDYNAFVKKYGLLNGVGNAIFKEDPHYPRLLALENYDRAMKTATPADIFTRRTIYPRQPLKSVSSNTTEALQQILAERGFPDTETLARLQNRDASEVEKELGDKGLIFKNPQSGQHETRSKYLSGYVRDKLAEAKAAVAQGQTEFQRNVDELEKVQPEIVPVKDITIKLGATWIPTTALQDFIREVMGSPSKVSYTAGEWRVEDVARTAEVTQVYGTPSAHAGELMQAALNQRAITVKVKDADGNESVDADATTMVRAQQEKIVKAFQDWAQGHKTWAPKLERIYNYAYNNLVLPTHDGSHLTFPGMAKVIKGKPFEMRPHQKDMVWQILQDGRGFIAHAVGAGKTYEVAASVMEQRRLGLAKKPMVAVPNHLVAQWRNEWMDLYPGAQLIVPTDDDFDSKNRNRLMSRIATSDCDAVILAHSQFDLMDISPEWQEKTLQRQMDELEETIAAVAKADGKKARTTKQLEKSKEKLRARMDKLRDLKADKTITFDKLGVDSLYVDEAHEYKNLAFYTKMQRVAGLGQGDSKKATRLQMKTQFLQEMHNGKGVVFATGTPVQNTMAEMQTQMRYVAPDVLEKAGIRTFDDWAANFGEAITAMELSADGRSFKARTKFARFVNVPELMNMFLSFANVKTKSDLALPVPKLRSGKNTLITVPSTPEVEDMVQSLMERAAAVRGERGQKPDPRVDNMLKITSDGRKAATDMRLVDPNAPDDPDSKINQAVDRIHEVWKESKAERGTQAVFLDMYRYLHQKWAEQPDGSKVAVGKPEELLNLYNDMRDKLVKMGVPREEIAVIQEAKTKAARQILFDRMNSGDLRILFGSTQKMGAGMNAQRRMVALHHIDLPWRPGDLEQREGRILRQGNLNEEVQVFNYLTEKSFDAYMAQALEGKATFIHQVLGGKYEGRTMVDAAGDMVLSLEEMKIASSGNPDVKLKFDLEMRLKQLESLERGWQSQQHQNRYSLFSDESSIEHYRQKLALLKESAEKYDAIVGTDPEKRGYSLEVDGKKFTDREEAGAYIKDMRVPYGNFHLTMNGIGVAVTPYQGEGDKRMTYMLPWTGGDKHDVPQLTMESLIRSLEHRLRLLNSSIRDTQETIEMKEQRVAKLKELQKSASFAEAKELAAIRKQIHEVNVRLGIADANSGKFAMDEAVAADVSDDDADESDTDGEGDGEQKALPRMVRPSERRTDTPEWMAVERASRADVARKAGGEVVDDPNGRYFLANHYAHRVISEALGYGLHNWDGVVLPPEDATSLVRFIRDQAAGYVADDSTADASLPLHRLASGIVRARTPEGIVAVMPPGFTPDTLREEQWHIWQMRYDLQDAVVQEMMACPLMDDFWAEALEVGYQGSDPYQMVAELTAKAASGDPLFDSLQPDARREILATYDAVLAKYGIKIDQRPAALLERSNANQAEFEGNRNAPEQPGRAGDGGSGEEARHGGDSALGPTEHRRLQKVAVPAVASSFWKSDVAPLLAKVSGNSRAAAVELTNWLYPRIGANKDALDKFMEAKGDRERHRFNLEHLQGGLEKFFDKMDRDDHIAFIDRYKLGVGQIDPQLQQIEDIMRKIDDESLQLAQKFKPTLKAKDNHFRVIWKVIPDPNGTHSGTKTGSAPGKGKRPFEGDKGFMKRATLETISEGINAGGEPITTNPWKLFSMAQSSIMNYVTAQQYWASLKKLGLRKFVSRGERPPDGWMEVPDKIASVYFPAASGEGMIDSGKWYVESSAGRLLVNFLSEDKLRNNVVGRGLMGMKNMATAVELSLSPFHFTFETLEAMGSQFGLGVQRMWNNGLREGDVSEIAKGARDAATAMAAPVRWARDGGSLLRATSNVQQFAQTARGAAFLKQFPNAPDLLDDLFTGGLQWGMNPDYRFDPHKSMMEAAREGNYVGAVLRSVPWVNHWLMKPLFETYIPRLKAGYALSQLAQQYDERADDIKAGKTTRAEIARAVIDSAENRFGEMNFDNLFWNNTMKSALQFAFRSVTWKLGNWRGFLTAFGKENMEGFADPLKAMWEDARKGKKTHQTKDYIPKMGMNQAWLLGMAVTTVTLGSIITKLYTGEWPWQHADGDTAMERAGNTLYEATHPRTNRTNEKTGRPERLSLPTGMKDFEHAAHDLPGYARGSMSETMGNFIDVAANRDFYGNYVYDPDGSYYQKFAQSFTYMLPKPIAVSSLRQSLSGGEDDTQTKAMKFAGINGGAANDHDFSDAERKMRTMMKSRLGGPKTPEQMDLLRDLQAEKQNPVAESREVRDEEYIKKLFDRLTYLEARKVYDKSATEEERRVMAPLLRKKRANLLGKGRDGRAMIAMADADE